MTRESDPPRRDSVPQDHTLQLPRTIRSAKVYKLSERRVCVSRDRPERGTTLASVRRSGARWWYGCGPIGHGCEEHRPSAPCRHSQALTVSRF
jgi:hypothetical protein